MILKHNVEEVGELGDIDLDPIHSRKREKSQQILVISTTLIILEDFCCNPPVP